MKYIQIVAAVLFFTAQANSQAILNTRLLGSLNPYPTRDYSDIWGWVDPQGREYAIIGVYHGTSIIDVTNPAQPIQKAFIPGPNSIWRDIKTHSHYAYITTEGSGPGTGLQIVNLATLPDTATLVNTVTTWFTTAHNIYIDNGYAYIIGTGNGGGMHILNLANPTNPVRTAYYTTSGYIHDVYVVDDTAYASSEDTYDIVDLTNKSNPVRISQSAALPGIYAHSGWLTEDKKYFIACEEFNVRDVTIWDVSDRTSWNLLTSQFQMPGNSPVHNVFVKGNYAHISYYKDGYVVLDITNKSNPVKVGHYDTYPGTTGTYEGAWGVYPYLPSGNIIVSDINTGLYIVDFLLDNNTVPVELTSFTAAFEGKSVALTWETATETNNRGFGVEVSYDEKEWHSIGFVNGRGTTTERNQYKFVYEPSVESVVWYRLAQYDFDGKINYSGLVKADLSGILSPGGFRLSQNYPNPFNPSTTIEFSVFSESFVRVDVYDVLGARVATLTERIFPAGSHRLNFDASGLSGGIYFYELNTGTARERKKMVLNK
ncbi:MAG: choice-of-anchor B family protein [Ignavibacteriaceae bacterium]|nr:choice-of-anchor B family protein [Ignavibacteriaceae bacterium]